MSDIEVAGLVTKLSIDDNQLNQSMASLNRQMQIAKSQAQVASSGMNAFGDSTRALKGHSDALSKQLEIQGARVAKLQQEHAKAVTEKGKDAKETQKLEVQLNKAVAQYNNLHGQLQATNRELQATNRELAIQTSNWTKAGNAMESAGGKMQAIGTGMESAGESLTRGVTVPIAAAAAGIAVLSREAKSFKDRMNEVFTLLPGISGEAMEQMSSQTKQFAKDFGVLPESVVPALYQAISAGVPKENVFDFLATAQKAAIGGVSNLKTSVDGISSVVNAYGADVLSATQASDLMFTAVRKGKTDFTQLSQSLFNVIPTASALNVEFGNVTAALATITAAGTPTSVATTQLRQLFVELSKDGGKAAVAFEQISGKSFKDFIAGGKNVQDALILMEKAAAKNNVGINDLFGSVEAGNAALGLTGKRAQSFTENLNDMANAVGATDKAFETMNKDRQLEKIQAELVVLRLEVAEKFLPIINDSLIPIFRENLMPVLKGAADGIANLAEWFSSLDKETQANVLRMIGFAAAAGPALVLIGKMATGLGALTTAAGTAAKLIGVKAAGAGLTAATTAFGTSTAGAAGSAGLLSKGLLSMVGGAGPLALWAAGIAGAGYGAYKLHQHMKQDAIPAVREFGDEVSDSTKKAMDSFFDLYDSADASLKQLKWSGETVSKDMATTMTTNFDGMSSQIIESLEESRTKGVESLRKLFADSKTISEDEQQAMLEALDEGYDKRKATIEVQNARIKEILETASSERRELTRTEQWEISAIQSQMKDTAIATMSEGELEQKAILERMKADAENFSARQAAEVVKNSIEQKEKTVAAAEGQYNDSIKQIIFLRDDAKSITADQADKLIAEAKRQRDGVVGLAEEMHDDVLAAAQQQAKDHLDNVDWETGQILSKWQVFKSKFAKLVGNIVVPKYDASDAFDYYPTSATASNKPTTSGGFGGLSSIQGFDDGGTVPGPIGAPRMILAHAGETILPTHKQGFAQSVHHTFDPLVVKGVNDKNELVAIVDVRVEKVVKDLLYWEGR